MYHTWGGLNFRRPLQNGEILEIISYAGGVLAGHLTFLLNKYLLRRISSQFKEGPSLQNSHVMIWLVLGSPNQSVTDIFEYSNIRIYLSQMYIRTFVHIDFLIQIYSDIPWYRYPDTNIFVYSFYFIQIYSDFRSYRVTDTNIFGY